jgi:hypothetical protein
LALGPGEGQVDVPVAGARYCAWRQKNPSGRLGVVLYPAGYSLDSAKAGYPIADPITVNGSEAFETYAPWDDPDIACLVFVETGEGRLVMAQYSWRGQGKTDRTSSCKRARSFAESAFKTLSR